MADRKPKSTPPAAKPKRAPALERKTLVRVSYQGEPGANSHLACPRGLSRPGAAGLRHLRGRAGGREGRGRPLRHDPDRELGGGARCRHPPPAARSRPAHRRRALPARAPPADGAAGRVAAHRQAGAVAHPGARPVPQYAAQARPQADPRGRHGRLRAHRRRGQQSRARGHRHHARRRDLRPEDPHARHRGREAQHHPLRRALRHAGRRQAGRRSRSSPPSSSACATCRRRSTRPWAASPPTAST